MSRKTEDRRQTTEVRRRRSDDRAQNQEGEKLRGCEGEKIGLVFELN